MNNDNYKKWFIGLAGGVVVLAGVLTSSFYVSYAKVKGELTQTSAELLNAQSQVEDLTKELEESSNAEEETREGYVTVMLQDGEKEDLPEIPFSVDLEDWNYVLVNEKNPLRQDFEVDLVKTDNGKYVDRRIQKALETMLADGKKEGQDQLMDNSIAKFVRGGMSYKDAFFKTKEEIALTGASEHHTGLAVDIVGKNHQGLDKSQASTKEAIWLNEHAAEYGFILRFPQDKVEITGISYESWHFRYVGEEAAKFMKENNLCLEEFVELAKAQQEQEALKEAEME